MNSKKTLRKSNKLTIFFANSEIENHVTIPIDRIGSQIFERQRK